MNQCMRIIFRTHTHTHTQWHTTRKYCAVEWPTSGTRVHSTWNVWEEDATGKWRSSNNVELGPSYDSNCQLLSVKQLFLRQNIFQDSNPFVPVAFFRQNIRMWPKKGSYRLPTHRRGSYRIFFRDTFFYLKRNFCNMVDTSTIQALMG